MTGPSDVAPTTTRKDRAIAKAAGLLSAAVFREVAVHWVTPPPVEGPELSLSNHFGGLSDGIVLVHALPRRPGIIARDVIWKIPIAGSIMTWIGGIPVHQPQDGGSSSNDQMFSSCYEALRAGRHLLIFPEGITRDEPSIGRVKTGAARIALGAQASGARGLVVTPIGIHYEDKAALRSRAVVIGGPPIELDEVVPTSPDGAVGPDDRAIVEELTARFDTELRRVASDYEDWHEARRLQTAAEVTLRSYQQGSGGEVPIEQRDRLANTLADRPPEARQVICDAVERYESDLDGLGVDDLTLREQLGGRSFIGSVLLQIVVGLILLPFAVLGAVLNLVPFLIVKAVGLLRLSPAVMASLKPAVAFLAFGITWGVEIWAAGRAFGVTGVAAAIVLIPAYSIATVIVFDRLVMIWRLFERWRASKRSLADRLTDERAAVVEAVVSS